MVGRREKHLWGCYKEASLCLQPSGNIFVTNGRSCGERDVGLNSGLKQLGFPKGWWAVSGVHGDPSIPHEPPFQYFLEPEPWAAASTLLLSANGTRLSGAQKIALGDTDNQMCITHQALTTQRTAFWNIKLTRCHWELPLRGRITLSEQQ